ncbi:MAG: P-loop NTPase [Nitriliruptorales bacterium]|nr:P-loop NTPase [Nitriliruptorales bacterium]
MELENLLDPRLIIVTGKGGVGKSTVAASLALAAAGTGRRTCLVEVEGRQTFSRLFSTQTWDFSEREFRPGLWGLSVDADASLREYLEMFYGARRLSRIVTNSSAVEFATTAAPGIKDVLLIGKVKEVERRRDPDGRFHYDLIVLDAPPTGRIVNFLRAPDATTELVNIGPIRDQAQSVIDMLLDPQRTNVHLVTLLEEMPVQETIDSARALDEVGVTLGPVVVNRVLSPRFDDTTRKAFEGLDVAATQRVVAKADVELTDQGAEALLRIGTLHLHRLELQERMRGILSRRLRLPLLELPYLWDEHFGADELAHLAEVVEESL